MSKTLHIGADTYRMDIFPLPATTETNPMPLDLVVGAGKAWLSCEFDRRIYNIPTTAVDGTTMTAIEIPTPAGIYRTTVLGGDSATLMGMAEDIAIDYWGNVWLTQCGANPYNGLETNLARLLRYKSSDGTWYSYPLPYNNAGAVALLPDGDKVWVTCSDGLATAGLAMTRPHSWTKADSTTTNTQPGPLNDGYRGWSVAPLKAGTWPAHTAMGPDGRIYICDYFGKSITAYDRTTGATQVYPLPVGSEGPWYIAFDLGGGCWVTCDNTKQIAKLNANNGSWVIYPTGLAPEEQLHSMVLSGSTAWFTAYAPTTGGRIGRRLGNGTMELSEPLDTLGILRGATGIAVNGAEIWVALFGHKAVGRLVKV